MSEESPPHGTRKPAWRVRECQVDDLEQMLLAFEEEGFAIFAVVPIGGQRGWFAVIGRRGT